MTVNLVASQVVVALTAVLPLASAVATPKDGGLLVFHLDFNTLQFRGETVSNLLEHVAANGYNAILWEIENKVRWESCPEVVSPDAYSKDEFRKLLSQARRLGLEPIPLLQTFGHAEYVLECEEYAHLRECPDRKNCYCPSLPESRRFLARFLDEYLDLFGRDVKHFHLGGDEVRGFGSCAACKSRDPFELYVEHLEAVSTELVRRKICPVIWHDMLRHFDKSCGTFARLPKRYAIWFWEYYTENRLSWDETAERALRNEVASGREIVFCPSAQCYRDDPFLVKYGMHRQNIAEAADACRRCGFPGLCLTSWSVHSGLKELQLPLVDFAALEFRKPDADAHWHDVVRRHFGVAPALALDDLTAWIDELGDIDGRYGRYKDAALPPPGLIETKAANRRDVYVGLAEEVRGRTLRALNRLREVPEAERTRLLRLAIEAGELKALYHQAQIARLKDGKPVDVPVERTRAFYSREQASWTVERSVRRIYDPLTGVTKHGGLP